MKSHLSNPVSCGRVLDEMQVEIVNAETLRRCDEGEVGEVWVAGPCVAKGYWNRPEETAQTFHARLAESEDGPFLRTGDLGFLRDGELFIAGRLKDLIIIRGDNHYPQDIELTVERSHPALRSGHGAAFSIDVGGAEELVVVCEVQGKQLREVNLDAVLSAIRAAVFNEHDLRLHEVVLLKPGGALKTTSGKIQRRAMRAAFLNGELDELGRQTATRSQSGIRSRLVASFGNDAVDASRSFADLGLDSVKAVELAIDLETWLGRPVPATVFWTYPNINALAEHLIDVQASGAASAPRFSATSRDYRGADAAPLANESQDQSVVPYSDDDIAIIGMGCRFPGADSPEAFWRLLERGGNAIGEIPHERWNVDDYFDLHTDAPGKMYVRHGGFVNAVDEFDAAFFGITPREAEELDPQQRLLLEVVWESLEQAGVAPTSLRGSEAGVFIGMSSDDHATWSHNGNGLAELNAYRTLGTARSIAAGINSCEIVI